MKTKNILLMYCPLLLFISCDIISTDDDGNTDQLVLTDDNYIYEGDLRTFYLERKIDTVQIKIDSLKAVIANQQGDENTQNELEDAQMQKNNFVDEIATIPEQSLLPKIKPRPKGPCDPVGTCFPLPIGLENLILELQNDIRQVTILDAKNQIISSTTTDAAPLMGYGDGLSYQKMTSFQGQPDDLVTIQVRNLSTNESYELIAFLFIGQ